MKARLALGGFKLDAATEPSLKSYDISQQGDELKLRAFLFRDGLLYKDGEAVTTIAAQDIDNDSKRRVGRGASGDVYFALHKRTGQPLAVKDIPITTKDHRDEVNAELAVLSQGIDHPHVIRHLGAFWNPETHSISLVMEWMAYSLDDVAAMLGPLDASTVALVAVQLVAGLRFLHDDMRVIHRDVKPSNILINSAGQVKYGDFGISKVVQTLQPSSTFKGTQLFMAPERLEEGEYGFVSDVWSLGLTLICCATGKRPWTEEGDADAGQANHAMLFMMLDRMRTAAVPQFPASFPPEAHDFAARCLERDPAKRARAAELAVHPFVAGLSVEHSRNELSGLLALAAELTRRAVDGQQ